MTRREREKKASLDALARIAYSAGGAPPPAPPPKPAAAPLSAPAKQAPPTRPSVPGHVTAGERLKRKRLEERRAKLDEEKALRDRRASELTRSSNLQWRGMDTLGVPSSIRRTGFDRQEATVAQKLHDILGDAKEKESRAKNREKGRRLGGH